MFSFDLNNTFIFLFKKMWKFGEKYRGKIILYLSLSFVSNLVLLAPPLIFKKFLDEIQINGFGEGNIKYLVSILFSLLLVTFVYWLLRGPYRYIQKILAFKIRNKYREYLMSNVLNFDLSWHKDRDSGDSIDKINKSGNGLYNFIIETDSITTMFIKIFGTTGALMFFNLYVGLLALGIFFLALLVTFFFNTRLVRQYKKLNIFENKISARIFDTLSNIMSVKILSIESLLFKNFKGSLWKPLTLYKRNIFLNEWKWFSGNMLFTSISVLPMVFYIIFSHRNNIFIEIGTLSAMYLYLSSLREAYLSFAVVYERMMFQKTQVQNSEEIEYFNSEFRDVKYFNKNWQNIVLNNITFKYPNTLQHTSNHLSNIDFSIKRGEKIACIGESGSGKTTFLKVLHGLYENTKAQIAFDDKVFKKTNFVDVNLKTTLVPQEPELFSSSIRENVTFGLSYSDDRVYSELECACFDGVLDSLPEKLNSVVNEKGVNLSGGEKQRLALARALLFSEDKEIILLDESTSSVDPFLEQKIYQNIFSRFSKKTFIASVHKMNLLKFFDRIVIFEKGMIIDQGSFDYLYTQNLNFRKQWDDYIK